MARSLAIAAIVIFALFDGHAATARDETVIEAAAQYPEGLFWDAETATMFYAEMTRHRVVRLVDGRAKPFVSEIGCGPTAIARAGAVMAIACHLGGYLLVTDADGKPLKRIREVADGGWLRNPNDVAGDGVGVYISDSGDFALSAPATGAILYWRPGAPPRRLARGLRYANGLVVDAARRRLLVSEHLARRILAFPITAAGVLGRPTRFADVDAMVSIGYQLGGPDGLDLGADGRLYAAVYGAARVIVLDAAGRLVGRFVRGERYVTTVALDGSNAYLFVAGAFDNTSPPFFGQVARVPLTAMRAPQR